MYAAIVFLPILGSAIAGLFGRLIGARASEIITTAFLFISAALSIIAFNDVALEGHKYIIQILPWIHSGDFAIDWTIRVDGITAVMLVVVTGVSSLVHLYSIGYMAEDPHRQRFFSYLSLFTFAMLMLVTANNFLQLFFGWEGVGLASYLLIGFWYTRPSANAAAIKAFVVTAWAISASRSASSASSISSARSISTPCLPPHRARWGTPSCSPVIRSMC